MKHSAKNRNGLSVGHETESALRDPLPRSSVAAGTGQLEHAPIGGGYGMVTARPAPAGARLPLAEPKSSRPTREEIEHRAYEIYLSRQGQDGSDVQDWLQAERELSNRF